MIKALGAWGFIVVMLLGQQFMFHPMFTDKPSTPDEMIFFLLMMAVPTIVYFCQPEKRNV